MIANNGSGFFDLLHKVTGQGEKDQSKQDQDDNAAWKSIIDKHCQSYMPTAEEDKDTYPGPMQKLRMRKTQHTAILRALAQALHANIERMHSVKLLSVQAPSWNSDEAGDDLERTTLERLGFLFQSYRPSVWFFEIIEIIRKLVMAWLINLIDL